MLSPKHDRSLDLTTLFVNLDESLDAERRVFFRQRQVGKTPNVNEIPIHNIAYAKDNLQLNWPNEEEFLDLNNVVNQQLVTNKNIVIGLFRELKDVLVQIVEECEINYIRMVQEQHERMLGDCDWQDLRAKYQEVFDVQHLQRIISTNTTNVADLNGKIKQYLDSEQRTEKKQELLGLFLKNSRKFERYNNEINFDFFSRIIEVNQELFADADHFLRHYNKYNAPRQHLVNSIRHFDLRLLSPSRLQVRRPSKPNQTQLVDNIKKEFARLQKFPKVVF